jgi:hypothetical protein
MVGEDLIITYRGAGQLPPLVKIHKGGLDSFSKTHKKLGGNQIPTDLKIITASLIIAGIVSNLNSCFKDN